MRDLAELNWNDGAEAVLKYTFQADDGVEYPFDFARVRFARVK